MRALAQQHKPSPPGRSRKPAQTHQLSQACCPPEEEAVQPAGFSNETSAVGFARDFTRIPASSDRSAGPEIGAEDDPLEHEADRIAERALRDPRASRLGAAAQSAPRLQRRCAACQERDEEELRRSPAVLSSPVRDRAPAIVTEILRSGGGRPLDRRARTFFERRFNHDFSRVRIFSGDSAARSAEAVNAKAFTLGHSIVFGAGEYAPQTIAGRHLLAHELAHVVQQTAHADSVRPMIRRRTVRRSYATTESELGPLCDVRLAITGAPDSNTEYLTNFIDASMEGIRSACGSLPRSASRAIRVSAPFRTGLLYTAISHEAYVAARVSVLGRAGDPAYVAEQERLAAERARVARLEANYQAAVRSGDWLDAAEYLNAFSDAGIATRLAPLTLTQLGELRRGATTNPDLGGGARLAAAIDAVNSDARRVAELIDRYETARAAYDWDKAAEHLNGFSASDIRARLLRLRRDQLSSLRDGAIRNPVLAGGGRLVGIIDAVTAPPPLTGVGHACFDGATITATKNGATHSCSAFTGSIGAPTPNGRFCVRVQGAAQIGGGFAGLVQDRSVWYLLEPQFSTTRSRMMLHPGSRSSGCITVNDRACFDQLSVVLNASGVDLGRGFDGYPPGNEAGVTNPERSVVCVAWLDVHSTVGACSP